MSVRQNLLGLWNARRGNPGSFDPALWASPNSGVRQDAAVQFTVADKSCLTKSDDATLDITTLDFLWCTWAYFDSLTDIRTLFYKYSTNVGYTCYVNTDGSIVGQMAGGSLETATSDASVITTGKWFFIAVYADRSGSLVVYVGDATTAPASKAIVADISASNGDGSNASALFVGAASATTYFHDGRLDSLMFFKAADLSAVAADIISWAYNSGSGRLCSEITAAQKTAWGAVSGWDLGEASGTRYDSWGTNHLDQAFAELVTNGTFTGNSMGWTEGDGWAYGTNNEAATEADANLTQTTVVPTVGKLYSTSFDLTATTGTMRIVFGGVNGTTRSTTATHTETIRATTTGTIVIDPVATFTGVLDTVSVQAAEILPCAGIVRGLSQDSNFALSLDGATQYASTTDSDFDPGKGDFSLFGYFYLNRIPPAETFSAIIDAGVNAAQGFYAILVNTNSTLSFYLNDGNADGSIWAASTSTVVPGRWYAFAVNSHRDGNAVLYINKEVWITKAITARKNSIDVNAFHIGSSTYPLYAYVDNVGYANRLLTSAEIIWLFNSGEGRQWAEFGVAGTDGANLTADVVKGMWEFDDASFASTALDSTGNENHLTTAGTPTRTMGINYAAGEVALWDDRSATGYDLSQASLSARPSWLSLGVNSQPALWFDGVDDALSFTSLSLTGGFMISIPFKLDATASDDTLIGTDGDNYVVLTDNTTVTVRIGGGDATAFTVGAMGTTTHILTVARDASDDVNVYLDGTVSDTGAASLAGTLALGYLGSRAASYFGGFICETVVYSSAKTTTARTQVERYLAHKYGVTL